MWFSPWLCGFTSLTWFVQPDYIMVPWFYILVESETYNVAYYVGTKEAAGRARNNAPQHQAMLVFGKGLI